MSDAIDDLIKKLDVPWGTKDGGIDLSKLPIESVMMQAFSENFDDFHTAVRVLSCMVSRGRTEAGIYLLGLSGFPCIQHDLKRMTLIVDGLSMFQTPECAQWLVNELYRVKGSNKTRAYLSAVIKSLSFFPLDMVEDYFEQLSSETKLSHRMRIKFRELLEKKRDTYQPH